MTPARMRTIYKVTKESYKELACAVIQRAIWDFEKLPDREIFTLINWFLSEDDDMFTFLWWLTVLGLEDPKGTAIYYELTNMAKEIRKSL